MRPPCYKKCNKEIGFIDGVSRYPNASTAVETDVTNSNYGLRLPHPDAGSLVGTVNYGFTCETSSQSAATGNSFQ